MCSKCFTSMISFVLAFNKLTYQLQIIFLTFGTCTVFIWLLYTYPNFQCLSKLSSSIITYPTSSLISFLLPNSQVAVRNAGVVSSRSCFLSRRKKLAPVLYFTPSLMVLGPPVCSLRQQTRLNIHSSEQFTSKAKRQSRTGEFKERTASVGLESATEPSPVWITRDD